MEHRWNIRHPAVIDVLLHHKEISEIQCKTRNIGRDGLFVETENMTYQPNTLLQVEFESNQDGIKQIHVLPAIVMHSSPDGLGLMFMQPNTYDFICTNSQIVKDSSNKASSTKQAQPVELTRLTG
jgi:hypothetical protein